VLANKPQAANVVAQRTAEVAIGRLCFNRFGKQKSDSAWPLWCCLATSTFVVPTGIVPCGLAGGFLGVAVVASSASAQTFRSNACTASTLLGEWTSRVGKAASAGGVKHVIVGGLGISRTGRGQTHGIGLDQSQLKNGGSTDGGMGTQQVVGMFVILLSGTQGHGGIATGRGTINGIFPRRFKFRHPLIQRFRIIVGQNGTSIVQSYRKHKHPYREKWSVESIRDDIRPW
jgi:hypothetical protein